MEDQQEHHILDGTGGGSGVARINASANSGSNIGGAGGNGYSKSSSSSYVTSYYYSGGGAGNKGGLGYKSIQGTTSAVLEKYGENGTGGLLVIFANVINNNNVINSNGSKGGNSDNISGGCSGGGSINIFYNQQYKNTGTIEVKGGSVTDTAIYPGGNGGEGSITITEI